MATLLVTANTIQEKVMALAASKAALFASVLDEGGCESATLPTDDLRGLVEQRRRP